jgi:hypothetical protein
VAAARQRNSVTSALAAGRQREVSNGGSAPAQHRRKLGGVTAAASAEVAAARSVAAVHIVTAAALRQWQGQWRWRQHDSATAQLWRQLGGSVALAAAAVAAVRSAALSHSATAAARWQQRGGCGGFPGTVCVHAYAHAFERHQHANVRIFIIGQGRRNDSADGIVVIGSDGGAHGDVHRGRQCAATADDDVSDDDTANADANGNDIVW